MTEYKLNYELIQAGKADGTSNVNIYGIVYIYNIGEGVLRLNASKELITAALAVGDITGLQDNLDGKINTAEKGAANGVATLNSSGKLNNSQVPAIAISETFVVASQAAMLALSAAEQGDVAVRTDLNKSFILTTNSPATLADWQELLTPTDAVSSVNGQTGAVALSASDVGAQAALSGTGILSFSGTTPSYLSSTGSGDVVKATSPTLVTPNIGSATGGSLSLSGSMSADAVTIGSLTQSATAAGLQTSLQTRNLSTATNALNRIRHGNDQSANALTFDIYGHNYTGNADRVNIINQNNGTLGLGGYGDVQLSLTNTLANISVPTTVPAIKITTGASNGYVLKSDASGNASWQPTTSAYKGTWNASTNTPTIADGTGATGDYYEVSTGGTQFGRTFVSGGRAIYNGSIWEPVGVSASVTSVNGLTGSTQINPSLSGNTLSLTGGTATVDISAATAVVANTAKVSNATHTGDASGSTSLTVTGINGTNLAGLGTGLLKNTTSTGVPTIAVPGTDYLTPTGSAAGLTSFPTLNQNTTGNANTASALQTARTINGVSFDGTSNITVTAAAGTLTGTTLNSGVTTSSLTSVGTLTSLNVSGIAASNSGFNLTQASASRGGFYPYNVLTGSGTDYSVGNFSEGDYWIATNGSSTKKVTVNSSGNLNAVGTVTGSNLSGTNTGDQTITLTGAVTGSGTGSFATTLASGIDATKLADGSVTNTELQYINSVTSNVQTQLDAKLATATASSTYQTLANLQTDLTASASKYPSVNAVNTGLALKENAVTAGTTSQYYRGDKSWQTLDKTAVGLSNVDNTSDANKPVSTATQTALDLKEDLSNKSANVALGSSNTLYPTQNAVKSYVDAAVVKFISDGYTPTITNGSNITSATVNPCHYSRIGNRVTVFGSISVTTTSGGATASDLQISLPVASTLSSTYEVSGFGSSEGSFVNPKIRADATNDTAKLTFGSTAATTEVIDFSFMYEVIAP